MVPTIIKRSIFRVVRSEDDSGREADVNVDGRGACDDAAAGRLLGLFDIYLSVVAGAEVADVLRVSAPAVAPPEPSLLNRPEAPE